MTQLPPPMTNADMYLSAIHAELVHLNATLFSLLNSPEDKVGGPTGLPADFPGRSELESAGITSLGEVPRTAKSLKAIKGIGVATATAIQKYLSGSGSSEGLNGL